MTTLSQDLADLSHLLKQKASIPQAVADKLRHLILGGRLKPGDRVVETRIARELGVGQPTVREALKVLEEEGLIIRHPNRGCTVTRLTSQQIEQIFRLRVEWEALAAELALENAGNWEISALLKLVDEMKSAAAKQDVEEFYRKDFDFHKTLWTLSGNPYLVRALSQMVIPLFALAILKRIRELDIDLVSAAEDHERIALALMGGGAQRAKDTVREVIGRFLKMTEPLAAD